MTLTARHMLIGIAIILWFVALLIAESALGNVNIEPISLVAAGLMSWGLAHLVP